MEKSISVTGVVVLFQFLHKSVAYSFFFLHWETPRHKVLCSASQQTGCDGLLPTNSSDFSAPEFGKRPVFASNQDLHTSSLAEHRFEFTRVPSCKSSPAPRREEVLHERASVGWVEKRGPLMQPLLTTGSEKDCCCRREEERGRPQAQHGWRLSVATFRCEHTSLTELFHQI